MTSPIGALASAVLERAGAAALEALLDHVADRGGEDAATLVRLVIGKLGPALVRGELDRWAQLEAADAALDAEERAKFGAEPGTNPK